MTVVGIWRSTMVVVVENWWSMSVVEYGWSMMVAMIKLGGQLWWSATMAVVKNGWSNVGDER